MANICFLVLLDLLVLEVWPLESCVIAMVLFGILYLGFLIGESGFPLAPSFFIRV